MHMQGAGPLARLAAGHRKCVSMTEAEGLEGPASSSAKVTSPDQQQQRAGSIKPRRNRRKRKAAKQTAAAAQRRIKFVHVRLNRVILRTTFVVSTCSRLSCSLPSCSISILERHHDSVLPYSAS